MKIRGPLNYLINDYIAKKDWRVRENSNQTFSLSALNLYLANHAVKDWWLSSVYPEEIAKAHIDGDLHIHDIGFLSAYTYYGREVVIAKINGVVKLISLERLYDVVDGSQRVADIRNHVFMKYPVDTYVLDHNGWVQVKRIVKKDKTRPLHLVVTSDGHSIIVTDNHPMVTYRHNKPALELGYDDSLLSEDISYLVNLDDLPRTNAVSINGANVYLTYDFGLLIGMLLMANAIRRNDHTVTFVFAAGLRQGIIDKLLGLFDRDMSRYGISLDSVISHSEKDVCIEVSGAEFVYLLEEVFDVLDGHRRIPENILNYSDDFVSGVIEGVTDMVRDNKSLGVINSRTMLQQVNILETLLEKKKAQWKHVAANNRTKIEDDSIYDITTTSGTLIVNGVLNHNCVGWDLLDLLMEGFGGVPGRVQSNPPKHFSTVLMQMVNFLFTVQNEVAGAVAFSDASMYLAPFIRYDKLTYDQVKQYMQEFVFNMNVATRSGQQSPFSNLTLNLTVPDYAKDQPVIIGGKPMNESYGDFQREVELFNRAFAEILYEGDAKGRPFSFPIGTINIDKNFDWDSDANDVLWDVTAKTGPFYFANFISSDMNPEDVRAMCPLDPDEKVLVNDNGFKLLPIGSLEDGKHRIFSDGKFVLGKFQKWDNQMPVTVYLENGQKVVMSDTHLNFVKRYPHGEIEELTGKYLRVGMYLPYSINRYEGEYGDYALGYLVGAFMQAGYIDDGLVFVFTEEEIENPSVGILGNIASAMRKHGFKADISGSISPTNNGVVYIKTHDTKLGDIINKFVYISNGEKLYNADILNTSVEFRKGLIDSHRDISDSIFDNGLFEMMSAVAASLGFIAALDRDSGLVEFIDPTVGGRYLVEDGYAWVRISHIEHDGEPKRMYCFEVLYDNPMFTVGGSGILTHNCHLKLDTRELKRKGGGLFGANPKTGSINVTTINLPRLAYLSRSEDEFLERLAEKMDTAVQIAEIKRSVIEDMTDIGLYPYSRRYLDSIKTPEGGWWDNHFDTVGLVGMNEALLNLNGTTTADDEGVDFTIKMLEFMRLRAQELQEKYGHLVNIEATPAESVSYRLAIKDREKFPKIRIYNQEKYGADRRPYYTNSTQLPVDFTNDPYEVARRQEIIQSLYTGGTVQHFYLGESLNFGIEAKAFVRKILTKFRLPYITLTPTFTVCPIHGRVPGSHKYCPYCDAELVKQARRGGTTPKIDIKLKR